MPTFVLFDVVIFPVVLATRLVIVLVDFVYQCFCQGVHACVCVCVCVCACVHVKWMSNAVQYDIYA